MATLLDEAMLVSVMGQIDDDGALGDDVGSDPDTELPEEEFGDDDNDDDADDDE